MFMGTFEHSLDAKGRLFLPRRFRDELGAGMVITRGIEPCLYVFPRAEFEAFATKLRTLPLNERPGRDFTRVLMSAASEERADAQGRVLIPQPLREYAGLRAEVTVVGQLNRVELWSPDRWATSIEAAQASFTDESNARHLAELGI